MKQKNIIVKQMLSYYLKSFVVFLVIYMAGSSLAYALTRFTTNDIRMISVSYSFYVFIFIATWLFFLKNITFYSYHSIARIDILKQGVFGQFFFSLIASFLLIAMNEVAALAHFSKFMASSRAIKSVYVAPLGVNQILNLIITGLFLMICLFTVMQIANLFAIIAYSWKMKKILIVLISSLIIILLVVISIRYWTSQMYSYGIAALGFLTGTGQNLVPSIVLPLIVLLIVLIFVLIFNSKKIKKIQINKETTF
ncbi:hypothetical protein ACWOAH_07910 [Vagococcus vulneris]|uniref:Uncharacterized protein n=1 Tax=Vagococcus vulneris TaxID=1977869 RepID=A0A429ZWP0_9ENTE|nr:hypothetical protein [Vagococcus vulneris]RST98229.1 hypothetical protein CBF37_08660 [Vagococcus vulneris]